MNTNLWFGALTTLAGVVLGGAISYVLSRQQMTETRAQRREAELSERDRLSRERRLDIYADFLTRAREFRNAIRRPSHPESGPRVSLHEIADLTRAADAAGSLVHLVNQSPQTAAACGNVMRTIGETSGVLHSVVGTDFAGVAWEDLNESTSLVLRSFQAAARVELGIDDMHGERTQAPR